MAAVQSLGGSERQREQFAEASRESFRQSLLLVWVANAVEWIAENVHLVFATAGLLVIFSGIVRGELTLGDTPVVIRMYSLLYETAMQFGRIRIDQQDNAAATRRVFFSMDHEAESAAASRPTTEPQWSEPLTLRFEGVGFRYPDGRRALDAVSFEATTGQTLAIVGPSGAGKTTLAQMIPKFLQPGDGRITLNDVDVAELDTTTLRRNVAYVFQEHQLLTDTVAANLRIADPDADIAEMEVRLPACRCPRLRPRHARWVRHENRPRRRHVVDGPETAPLHRTRPLAPRPHPDPGRTDSRTRSGDRTGLAGFPVRFPPRRPNHRHRPPAIDHRARRPHRPTSTKDASSRPAPTTT